MRAGALLLYITISEASAQGSFVSFVRVTPPSPSHPTPTKEPHQGEAIASPGGVLSSNKLFCKSFLLSHSSCLYACHVNGQQACVNSWHHSGRQHGYVKGSQLQKVYALEYLFFLGFGAKLL